MLSNEQAKKEAIKNAYGENMDIVKDRLYGSWCMLRLNETPGTFGFKDNEVQRTSSGAFRPNMLIGINDNNGWIRIEPDGSNLPEPGEYRWLFESGSMSNFYYEPGDIMSTKLTHYKPITPELKPIY